MRRTASASSGVRPTLTPGGVRNQYRIRGRPFPLLRGVWTTNVFSYPRPSLLNLSCGRGTSYFLLAVRAVLLAAFAAGFAAALVAFAGALALVAATFGFGAGSLAFFTATGAASDFAARGAGFGSGARRGSGCADFCTNVNRVWSPIVWNVHNSEMFTWFSVASRRAISTQLAGT